ncbi:MAG TPA: hypothetical protein VJV78_23995 [Polyangiales bacterium]|nr:hypothetical protein [Polyangiales bacterium]
MTQPRCGAALLVAITTLLSGCPDPSSSGVRARCVKAYERCLLSGGVLGVCDQVDCEPSQAPPCFVCRSQH